MSISGSLISHAPSPYPATMPPSVTPDEATDSLAAGNSLERGDSNAVPAGAITASGEAIQSGDAPNKSDEQESASDSDTKSRSGDKATDSADLNTQDLTPEEQEQVEKLKQRDAEVRRHEQAHLAAAGQHARGGPSFTYQRGPDGRSYAIGGEVSIDTSPEEDPQATINKARAIRRAALAPAEPSSTDRAVAAQASKMMIEAQQQLRQERIEEQQAGDGGSSTPASDQATETSGQSLQQDASRKGELVDVAG